MSSCDRDTSVSNITEYGEWLNNSKNGLVKTNKVNGLIFEMKFLPTSFLALKDYKLTSEKEPFGSSIDKYSNGLNFVLSIKMANKEDIESQDLLFSGINSYREYKERFYAMNFNISSQIKLTLNDKIEYPLDAHYENTYGASNKKVINILFNQSLKDIEEDEINVSFKDELFNTGIHHFIFNKSQINLAPEIKLL